MLPATSQSKNRKRRVAEDPLDPYELVRRLSIIQAEETLKELDRRRTDWETELVEARGIRQGQVRTRTQSTPNILSYKQHKHSAAVSLAPDQLPPPVSYTHLPEPARRQSHPIISRPKYATSPRRPSLKSGDSGDLETINENAVVEPTKENPFLEWMGNQRRRPSALPRVDEAIDPGAVSTQPKARRRSSLSAQKEHRRQNHSQSDDDSSRTGSRRPSLLDKFEQYWKPGQVDASKSDAFDSKASTLRSSWRSSMGDLTSSRRPSILKKIGDYWVVSPPSSDEKPNLKDIHTDEDDSVVDSPIAAKKKANLFSKLRH